MQFEPFFFYTNQNMLKRFLVKYSIFSLPHGTKQTASLSDDGQGRLLFWKHEVDTDTLTAFCQTNATDNAIVLRVLLPTELTATADKFGIVCVDTSVPFFNVSDIMYVDKPIRFLQGDSTQIIPTELLRAEPYTPQNTLDIAITEQAIEQHLQQHSTATIDLNDEFENDDSTTVENAEENRQPDDYIDKSDRLIAGYLMFIQGTTAFEYTLTPRIYYSLDGKEPFGDFVTHTVYPMVSPTIVKTYCEKLDTQSRAYLSALKTSSSANTDCIVYSAAIKALLQTSCSTQDRQRFLQYFIDRLPSELHSFTIETFADKRARNRIATLKDNLPALTPIYFLYTFWDYRFDRFCENMAEFKLSTSFSNVTLSLWALLHGMDDLYSEYKNIELLYAVKNLLTEQEEAHYCLPYEEFAKINNIKNSKKIKVSTVPCNYVNYEIEYHYCVDEKSAEIAGLLDALKTALDETFDFLYTDLRKQIYGTTNQIASRELILKNKVIIHKRFTELSKRSAPAKNSKKRVSRRQSSKTPRQQSIFDNPEEYK